MQAKTMLWNGVAFYSRNASAHPLAQSPQAALLPVSSIEQRRPPTCARMVLLCFRLVLCFRSVPSIIIADFIAVSPYDVNSRLGATFKLSFNAFPGECGRQARGQPGWQRWMAVAGRGHVNQRWSSAAVAAPSSQYSHIAFSFRE